MKYFEAIGPIPSRGRDFSILYHFWFTVRLNRLVPNEEGHFTWEEM
jgi:hypothetical protein